MPWDFEPDDATVKIDPNEVLEYVKSNKDWFMERLGESKRGLQTEILNVENQIKDILNSYNNIRLMRDGLTENKNSIAIGLYEKIENIKSMVGGLLNE